MVPFPSVMMTASLGIIPLFSLYAMTLLDDAAISLRDLFLLFAGTIIGSTLTVLVRPCDTPKSGPGSAEENKVRDISAGLPKADQDEAQSNTGTLLCSMCRAWQPPEAFMPKQARRHASRRKCLKCVSGFEATSDNSYWAAYHNRHPDMQPGTPAASQQAVAETAQQAEEGGGVGAAVVQPASAEGDRGGADVGGGSLKVGGVSAQASGECGTSTALEGEFDSASDPLRLARKAETVLRGRTSRILLVVENCTDDFNHVAVLRSCEAMGIQYVWLIQAPLTRHHQDSNMARRRKAKHKDDYDPLLGLGRARLYCSHLDVRVFDKAADCLAALRADGREIWATDLRQSALCLSPGEVTVPARLAVVIGRECDGVSEEMLAAADRCVFLPMVGFTESYNLSVATALVLQRLLDECPEARGDMPESEKTRLRHQWYQDLARSVEQREKFEALAAAGGAQPFLDTRRPEEHRVDRVTPRLRKRQEAAAAAAAATHP